jgi:hypothetical protein
MRVCDPKLLTHPRLNSRSRFEKDLRAPTEEEAGLDPFLVSVKGICKTEDASSLLRDAWE